MPESSLLGSAPSLYQGAVRFRTNEMGAVLPLGGEGPCRVAFIGGSTTEAHWMPEDLRWPYVVGQYESLRKLVTTYNFGVGGYNLHQNFIKYLMLVAPLKPSVVVVMHHINDVGKYFHGGYYALEGQSLHDAYEVQDDELSLLDRIKRLTALSFPTLQRVWRRYRNRHADVGERGRAAEAFSEERLVQALADYRSRLEMFRSLVLSQGARFIVMTQPNRSAAILAGRGSEAVRKNLESMLRVRGLTERQYVDTLDAFERALRDFALHSGTPLIDLKAALPANDETMYDTIHYSPEGSRQVAAIVARHLAPTIQACCASAEKGVGRNCFNASKPDSIDK